MRVQFGATDLHGPPDAAIIERCGAPVENVFHQEDNVGIIALCHDCRLKVFGLTSGERRKRTIANKNSQLALLVREKDK